MKNRHFYHNLSAFICQSLGGLTFLTTCFSCAIPSDNVNPNAVFTGSGGQIQNLTQYVTMHLGTSGSSNTIIGPQRPNASVNPSPDTWPQNDCTGYMPGRPIRGFSQIHVSGTGVGKYGQFLVSPQVGLATRLNRHDSPKRNENPTCSEYNVGLTRYNIDVSFTPAEHSVIYKFVYPKTSALNKASVLIDIAANIALANPTSVRVNTGVNEKGETFFTGSGYYPGGWGQPHNLYFYAVLSKTDVTAGVYDGTGPIAGTSLGPVNISNRESGMGVYAKFRTTKGEIVYLKIATSFKSVEQAKVWLNNEIPEWDYDRVRQETEHLWNQELKKIIIEGNIKDNAKRIFYTALYHAHVMPRDRTGDIAKYGNTDTIDDHLCIWDTWRTLYPLYAITNPDLVTKTINSFITRYEMNRYVRDSFVGGNDMPEQQGGDNIDNVIADAYVKRIGGIDWQAAYKVVENNAENYRLSFTGFGSDNLIPNFNSEYRTLGYIPIDSGNNGFMNCSYTLEYAYNDFCVAQIAKGLGLTEDYNKYLRRSGNWINLWNPNIACDQSIYKGFIWPRNADGSFASSPLWAPNTGRGTNFTPTTSGDSWKEFFYEATAWDYSFFVPHNVPRLIELMEMNNGKGSFADRLKYGIEKNWVDIGNEPAFLAPVLFNYTDRPWMTSDVMANLRNRFSLNGVLGNDDSGALSSWYIFSATGFFPNSGQDKYYITSPIFERTTFNLDNGNKFTIIANGISDSNKYIQSVKINGVPYYKTYFTHEVIVNGGTVEYQMGPAMVNYAKTDY
jgi:predicted alpha-1,2-mannosidase